MCLFLLQVVAGGLHTCAIANASAKCWGFGLYGQLGHGSTSNLGDDSGERLAMMSDRCRRLRMQMLDAIALPGDPSDIAAGFAHTCFLLSNSVSLTCIGLGTSGQLGDGTFSIIGDSPDEQLDTLS